MTSDIKFESLSQVEEYALKNKKILLVYDDYVLDATSFACHHPGGPGLIKNFQTKNVTKQINEHQPLSLHLANSMAIGSFKKEISRIINPQKPLMMQIWNMDHKSYLNIVQSPHWLFVPSPRMFETQILQPLSHNKWYHVFFLPILFVCYLSYITNWQNSQLLYLVLTFLFGALAFTLTEYLVHRFIFHGQKRLLDNRLMRYIHYLMHGIHHMLPNDPNRLVFPPPFALITFILGYLTIYKVVYFQNEAYNAVFWSGYLLMYSIYDSTHYFLHFSDATKHKGTYFSKIQKYHNQHHYGGQPAGYGVSSNLWDIIFRTQFKETFKHGQKKEQKNK